MRATAPFRREDVPLTPRGEEEARTAAELLLTEAGDLRIDTVYTSVLGRALRTAGLCVEALRRNGRPPPPILPTWRLNERHYGMLTGLNKREALTSEAIKASDLRHWRSSFEGKPPPMREAHPHYSRTLIRFKRLEAATSGAEEPLRISDVPLSESLADTRDRVRPLWEEELLPYVLEGKNVLVVGHANCLRALISCIQTNLRDEHLPSLGVPNALPLVYSFDEEGEPVSELPDRCYVRPLDAHYLGDACVLVCISNSSVQRALLRSVYALPPTPLFHQLCLSPTSPSSRPAQFSELDADGSGALDADEFDNSEFCKVAFEPVRVEWRCGVAIGSLPPACCALPLLSWGG